MDEFNAQVVSHATAYAGLGWHVFPLRPRSKEPWTQAGFKDASSDAAAIQRDFADRPSANVGIATGLVSGIVVIDVDPDKDGAASLARLEQQHGALPATVEQHTGGGGRHLIFQHPGRKVRNSAGTLGDGLDVRGDGGYIVAPPSVHDKTSRMYLWRVGASPFEIRPLPLPESWLALMTGSADACPPIASAHAEGTAERIPKGKRNSTLTSLAGTMRRKGMTAAAIEAALLAEARERCGPFDDSFTEDEVRRIAASVSRYDAEPAGEKEKKATLADFVASIASELELWHSADDGVRTGHATMLASGHRETHVIDSRAFADWIRAKMYEVSGRGMSDAHLAEAVNTCNARACFEGPRRNAAVRVAGAHEHVQFDLGDADWRGVWVDQGGPRVVAGDHLPTRFVRKAGMLSCPVPDFSGSLHELRSVLNLARDEDWMLLAGWLIGALSPFGPYPILIVSGEQGSAKSSLCRLVRSLIDPNSAPLRTPPRDDRDLMISVRNQWVAAFDNRSGLKPELSDALCRVATGAAFTARRHYTNDEEVLLAAKRPVIINGIDDLATRADLADRAITLHLPAIPPERRRGELEINGLYESLRPRILGGLFMAVWGALCYRSTIQLARMPRMADFVTWVEAASGVMGWERGRFQSVYEQNLQQSGLIAIESCPIGPAVLRLMQEVSNWRGTPTELLAVLMRHSEPGSASRWGWPKDASALGRLLRRLAPNLRREGIEQRPESDGRGDAKRRIIVLERIGG